MKTIKPRDIIKNMKVVDLVNVFDNSRFKIVKLSKIKYKCNPDKIFNHEFLIFEGTKNDFLSCYFTEYEKKITNEEFRLKMMLNRAIVMNYDVIEYQIKDSTIVVKDPEKRLTNLTN